jgi:flagellar biosynthetic protein FliO
MAGQSDPLLSDPNAPGETDTGFGNTELFLKMMFSVVLVLALGAAAVYTSKKLLPRVAHAQGREVRVRETTYLGPRKALHLVEVGEQRLLIGSTNESITTLAHLTEAWLDVAKPDVDGTVKV